MWSGATYTCKKQYFELLLCDYKNSIEQILKKDEFKDLAKDSPELFESLIGDIEEADMEWEYLSKQAYGFLGKVENLYILSGAKEFQLPEMMAQNFSELDRAIAEHKKYCAETSQKMMERAKEISKDFNWMGQTNNDQKVVDKKSSDSTIFLNKLGELYKEPKNEHCYPIGETSIRHKIVRFLIKNNEYQQTKIITMETGGKNEQTTRTEIRKIRDNIKKYVGIDGKDYLQGKKESGYRINPKYKTVIKDE